MSQSEEEKRLEKNRYRFQGYQLPKIQLDETGATYYKVSPHPYLYNQPEYWQQPVYNGSPYGGVNDLVDTDTGTTADNPPVIDTQDTKGVNDNDGNSKGGNLYPLLPPEK